MAELNSTAKEMPDVHQASKQSIREVQFGRDPSVFLQQQ